MIYNQIKQMEQLFIAKYLDDGTCDSLIIVQILFF